MNCYGLPANERDYYRLAHRAPHRPQQGAVSSQRRRGRRLRPGWDGKRLDWSAWDKRFGPYFDGSAFADLPRKGVPLEGFYLPLFENWPTPMEGNYNGDYWADRAFPASYRKNFVEVSRQFAEHCDGKGWDDTLFQCFFNGKNNFKERGWSRGTSPLAAGRAVELPGLLGAALVRRRLPRGRQPGTAGQGETGVPLATSPGRSGSATPSTACWITTWSAGPCGRTSAWSWTARRPTASSWSSTPAATPSRTRTCSRSAGASTPGRAGPTASCRGRRWATADSWKKADELSLFYPGRDAQEGPVPSIRLKAYRRGQQDVEYLTLLGQVKGEPRWAVGERVREALHLTGEHKIAGGEDAGVVNFARLKPQELWALRVQVGAALSEAAPPAKRRLIDLRTPPRDPAHLSPGYVSVGEGPAAAPASGPAAELGPIIAAALVLVGLLAGGLYVLRSGR